MAPSSTDAVTAGSVILTEFQNAGPMPSQVIPWHAEPQASIHGCTVMAWGSAKRSPVRISLISFSEVTSIT